MTGAGGLLGSAVAAEAAARGWDAAALPRSALDVTDADAVLRAVDHRRPEAVVHCAAYTAVDRAEAEEAEALRVNRDATRHVAAAAADAGALLLYPSSDYVFDGSKGAPYLPGDPVAPLSAYGRSKAAGEEEARRAPRHLVVRTSWLYGAGGRNFVDAILARGEAGEPLRVVADQRGRPTWSRSLARALLDLMERGAQGTLHVADRGVATWWELAVEALRLAGVAGLPVEAIATGDWPAAAPRPAESVLDLGDAERTLGGPLPHWKDSLARHVAERRAAKEGAKATG